VFSPVDDSHERVVAEALARRLPDVAISLSSEIGKIGLLERENATIVNACLRGLADRIVAGFETSVRELGIKAPLYLSQNDGTMMSADYTNRYPVATFASGPTNSMRGAAHLSGEADCVVVDVGGTTSDVGVLRGGFPREAPLTVQIAGVRTNFRMPDVISLGIGGGSIVHTDEDVRVGPTSVGSRITEKGLVFGGSTLTATDVAVAAGVAEIGDPKRVRHLDRGLVRAAMEWMRLRVGDAIERMKTGPHPIPVVLVGGGSILLTDDIPGASRVTRPGHFSVANAIGAAIAKVGGQVDHVVSLEEKTREVALADARAEAIERCVAAGAAPSTVEVVEIDEVPLAYLPSSAVRFRVRATGELGEEPDADPR
jgi:N-methylhydantoinase A/oxoprolinase/acetone carboxylase beta subunit